MNIVYEFITYYEFIVYEFIDYEFIPMNSSTSEFIYEFIVVKVPDVEFVHAASNHRLFCLQNHNGADLHGGCISD